MKLLTAPCSWIRVAAAAWLLCAAAVVASAADLPTDSVYQLAVKLEDQDGHPFQLADRRGQAMLVSFFYTSCQFVCPRLVDTLRDTVRGLPDGIGSQVSILLVSIDPVRDTVSVLKGVADQRQLERGRWTLARTDPASVRKLAAVLGVQYRALPDGDFNHSTELILLDREGRLVARSAQLGSADPVLLKRISALLMAGPH